MRPASASAMRCAAGPLSRAIATPPRPAGVATATMVSSTACTGRPAWRYFTEMMTVFSKESPMLSDATESIAVTAMCTIRRS
jgi:hypothetical protein